MPVVAGVTISEPDTLASADDHADLRPQLVHIAEYIPVQICK
jgi:hypothetical protein